MKAQCVVQSEARGRPWAAKGASLTEVLLALMVMSIGVVSVIALFPIAIVRSAQATQLNHAAIVRLNAESLLRVRKALSPQRDGLLRRHDPDGPGPAPEATIDFSVTPPPYIIDPYGWVENSVTATGLQDYFGNDGAIPPAPILIRRRFNGGIRDFAEADRVAASPDSWSLQFQEIPVATTPTSVTFAPSVSLAGITPVGTVRSRVVLLTNSGAASEVRETTAITGNTISWSASLPLPAGFTVETVRVESFTRRYTWFATVRRNGPGISADLVVVFNRSLPTNDEQVYKAHFEAGQSTAVVDWSASGGKPLLKKGSFVFDLDNAYWYRIQDVVLTATSTATLTLQTPARSSSPPPSTPAAPQGHGVLMRGIVEVFPIEDL